MATTQAYSEPGAEAGGGRATVAVAGRNDPVTQRVAGVLSQHEFNVVFHPSPTDLLAGIYEERGSASGMAVKKDRPAQAQAMVGLRQEPMVRPALYVLNFRGLQARGKGYRALLGALEALNNQTPRAAILVAVDNELTHSMIRGVIAAGADEILRAGDTEIDELVWTRVQSAMAKTDAEPRVARHAYRTFSTTASEAPALGVERRVAERRRSQAGGAAALSTSPAAAGAAGDVVETWEAPASADEVHTARERVRTALEGLPRPEDRGGPLADLLGVTAPTLRAESGRLDAKKIASHLGISLTRLAGITPISRQALNETPDSAHAQRALDPLARILDILGTALPHEHISAWLSAPHARLGGETPLHTILEGRGEQVARMLELARDGGVG